MHLRFRVQDSGFRVQGSGFRGLGFRVYPDPDRALMVRKSGYLGHLRG